MKENTLLNKIDLENPSLMSDFSGVKEYVYDDYQFPAYNSSIPLDTPTLQEITTLITQYVFNNDSTIQTATTTYQTNVGILSYCTSSISNVIQKGYLCFVTLDNNNAITRMHTYKITAPKQFTISSSALTCGEKIIMGKETTQQEGNVFRLPSKSFFLEGIHKDVVVVDETINIVS